MIAVGIFFLVLANSATLLFPMGLGRMMDAKTPSELNRTALLMALVLGVAGIAMGVRFVLFTIAGERVVARLRERSLSRILSTRRSPSSTSAAPAS